MTCKYEKSRSTFGDDDDNSFSDSSTVKSFSNGEPNQIRSRSFAESYTIENEIYRSGNFDENSVTDYDTDDETDVEKEYNISMSATRLRRIDTTPEAMEKRRRAFENWLKNVTKREQKRKQLQQERIEAERLRQLELEEERRMENDKKVREWNEKKRREAQKKMSRIHELKQATIDRVKAPKEFKKALRFDEWVAKKNKDLKNTKEQQAKEREMENLYSKTREVLSATSYKKWMHNSKNTAKPVPFNRGLDSLRGSTTSLFVNPNQWITD